MTCLSTKPKDSISVAAEARQPQTAPFDRQLLAEMLGITEDSNSYKV